ncbi:MAG: hypothetical protein Kow00120_10120 [Anaerolineae bacterium]
MAVFRVLVRAQAQPVQPRRIVDPLPRQSLKWPGICPCCLQAITPHESVPLALSRSRIYDQRFGKVEKKMTWKVPYCKPCRDHINTQKKAREARYIGFAAFALAAVFALLMVIDALQGQPRQWAVERVLLFSGFLSVIGAAMLLWSRSLRRKAQAMMKATCCQVSEAVAYQGYDRDDVTMQTFVFHSLVYAHAFATANGSVVEPIADAERRADGKRWL